jgi:hypothetical protein
VSKVGLSSGDALASGEGEGEGETLSFGDAVGVGVGVGELFFFLPFAEGEGDGVAESSGEAVGLGDGLADGEAVGFGVADDFDLVGDGLGVGVDFWLLELFRFFGVGVGGGFKIFFILSPRLGSARASGMDVNASAHTTRTTAAAGRTNFTGRVPAGSLC